MTIDHAFVPAGNLYEVRLDKNLVEEAETVMKLFSTPARKLVEGNTYGPREARFAAVIVQCARARALTQKALEEEARKPEPESDETVFLRELCTMLAEATDIIEERIAGYADRVRDFREQIEATKAEFSAAAMTPPTSKAVPVDVALLPSAESCAGLLPSMKSTF